MSRPPYPHRCLGGDPFAWACRCKATPDIYGAETARDGWGSGCPAALREALAEAEAALASGRACSNPLTALLDRLAEGAQVAAEEVDAAVGSVVTFDSEAPALAGLGGEQMQRIRLEVACVRGDSLTPQARLREYRLRAERAEAERDDALIRLGRMVATDEARLAELRKATDAAEAMARQPRYDAAELARLRTEIDSIRQRTADACSGTGLNPCNAGEVPNVVGVLVSRLNASQDEARRLRDLVRHQRGPLHDAELLTDEEYADLAADAGAVARLRGYDEVRRELADLRTLGASIHKAVAAAMEAKAKELDAKADAAFDGAAMYGAPFPQGKGEVASARREAYRVAARIVRGA